MKMESVIEPTTDDIAGHNFRDATRLFFINACENTTQMLFTVHQYLECCDTDYW